ncbi:MAG: DUF3810 domain-containing protein, partial [Blastocatellia bacterium]
ASGSPPEPEVVEEIVEEGGGAAGFRTRRHYWRGIVWLLVALGIQFVASLIPDVVERVYSTTLYRYIVRVLAIPGNLLGGFVLGEVFFVLLLFYFFIWGIWYLLRSWRRQTRFFHVIKLFFLHVLWVMSILFPIFLFVWGLNYQRMPLADTLGLDRRPAARTGELETIALQLINGVNTYYEQARAGQDWTTGSRLPLGIPKLNQSIEAAFQAESSLGAASQGGFAEPKPLRFSRITTLLGISGFYIAYTAEVAYNSEIPAVDLPMTIAHHKAHQRGYAREDEANFIGFLICAKANEPYVRYSGYMHALRVLEPMAKGDRARYAELFTRLNPGAQTDLRVRSSFWGNEKSTYLGPVSRRLFDMYLRANRVQGGVQNYDEDIYLMTSYFLKNLNPLAPTELTPQGPAAAAPTPTPDFSEDP